MGPALGHSSYDWGMRHPSGRSIWMTGATGWTVLKYSFGRAGFARSCVAQQNLGRAVAGEIRLFAALGVLSPANVINIP
jgi:hypothetical protein